MIPPEKIEQIIASTDIASLVGQYVTLKRAGKSLKGLCPFHSEKTPSFIVTPEKGIFKCFGCGVGGGPIQFLMKIENLGFIDAVKILAQNAGIAIQTSQRERRELSERELYRKILKTTTRFYQEILLNKPHGKEALGYLKHRGLSVKTIADFQLGYAPVSGDFLVRHLRSRKFDYALMEKAGIARRSGRDCVDYFRGRIIYPIADSQGRVIGLGGRVTDPAVTPKYLNTPETPIFSKRNILYGLHLAKAAIRKEEEVFIVEGYMDAIALAEVGISNVAASMGTSLTEQQARQIARYTTNVIFAYDADTAGQAATLRGIEIFEKAGLNVKVMSMPPGEDPDSIVQKKGVEYFHTLAGQALGIVNYKIDQARSRFDLETPEGKQRFVKEIVPVLKQVKGDVRRSEYIRLISERHYIPENILRRAVSRKKARNYAVDVSPIMKKRKLLPEERLLAYLFSNPKYVEICKNAGLTDDYMDADIFKIYASLLEHDLTGVDLVGADFLYRITKDEDLLKKAVDVSMVEGLPACSEEEIRAILREIENREKDRRIDEIRRKVSSGLITAGDPEYLEMIQLLRERKVPGKQGS